MFQQRRNRPSSAGAGGLLRPAEVRAPEGVRIRVQVLNATKTRGLARRATMLLRDRGFDVVENGNAAADSETRRSCSISQVIRSGRTASPRFSRRPRSTARADSSRYLDIAVVIGSTWRPPSQPFYP